VSNQLLTVQFEYKMYFMKGECPLRNHKNKVLIRVL